MNNIEKIISPFVESQFPSFYRDEGPNFIAFMKAYYEWAEQADQTIGQTRSLYDIKDLDHTQTQFIKYFKNKYINSLPESIVADKQLLIKHILELYRTKGTKRAYELLFRLLFNEDIDIFIPGDYLFKLSDATWFIKKYIEVSDNPLLPELIGKVIYSKKESQAVVEDYYVKIVNNKTINVLVLSNIQGSFKFGEKILCTDIPQITTDNAPIVFGSLSSVSIVNGGSNFNIGDVLNVTGAGGVGGKARVVATTNQNGKVAFNLINGGYGFSVNAVVTVTGGYGAGANFAVGQIVNKQIYQINRDKLGNYYNTQMESSAAGVTLNVTGETGTFTNGETLTQPSSNTRVFDVTYVTGASANGESYSNSSLGITGLIGYRVDGTSISVYGNDTSLMSANLVSGVKLISNVSSTVILLNSISGKATNSPTGTVVTSNTSQIVVNNITGYYIPGLRVTGGSSTHTANVTSVVRNTDWLFPYAVAGNYLSNLDTQTKNMLTIVIKEVGTIAYLTNVNPGIGYSANPTVSIIEPDIYDLRIPDPSGTGFYGYDAVVTANAGTANGVVTAVQISDSGFGYIPDETVFLSSPNNATSVVGVSVVDLNGQSSGTWLNNKSFLSDLMAIQDSNYYQTFSYEILATRMKDTYEKFVNDLIHISGIALFGRYSIKSELVSGDNVVVPVANNGIIQS